MTLLLAPEFATVKADKPKVVDEVWSEDRVRGFLYRGDIGPRHPDAFAVLLRAYQGMRPGDFERFIDEYVRAGGDLNTKDPAGRTLCDYIDSHRHAAPFIDLLVAAGARPPARAQA
jgi:hypothetical protein